MKTAKRTTRVISLGLSRPSIFRHALNIKNPPHIITLTLAVVTPYVLFAHPRLSPSTASTKSHEKHFVCSDLSMILTGSAIHPKLQNRDLLVGNASSVVRNASPCQGQMPSAPVFSITADPGSTFSISEEHGVFRRSRESAQMQEQSPDAGPGRRCGWRSSRGALVDAVRRGCLLQFSQARFDALDRRKRPLDVLALFPDVC